MNRVVASGALAAFIAAMVVIALASTGSNGSSSPTTTAATTRAVTTARTTTTTPPPPVRIALTAVGSYDPPPGDGTERDAEVPNAVDGNPATFWSTEHYSSPLERYKQGVGIVLDAGRKRPIGRVLVGTDDTSGSRAQIRLGDSPTGPFRVASADHELVRTTTFRLKPGAAGRYVLVWITAVSPATGEAHVTEVRALSR